MMNLTRMTDPLGRTVKSYVLDNDNRPVQITNIDGQQMSVLYGLGDRVKSVTRFDGSIVTNTYDTDGRLSKSVFPGTTNTFTYYRNDLLKTVANEAGTISNTYDAVNRLTGVSQCAPSGNVSYTYYPAATSPASSASQAQRYTRMTPPNGYQLQGSRVQLRLLLQHQQRPDVRNDLSQRGAVRLPVRRHGPDYGDYMDGPANERPEKLRIRIQ